MLIKKRSMQLGIQNRLTSKTTETPLPLIDLPYSKVLVTYC
jgi:hypothetical protein